MIGYNIGKVFNTYHSVISFKIARNRYEILAIPPFTYRRRNKVVNRANCSYTGLIISIVAKNII